jgi:hypothetical protein
MCRQAIINLDFGCKQHIVLVGVIIKK